LTFKEYNQPLDGNIFQLTNNGHTVELSLIQSMINPDDIPLIKGPALEEHSYKFVQLHFHWHTNDSLGSEHAIDGQRYALEVSPIDLRSHHF
jgi:carbonic anhydrase